MFEQIIDKASQKLHTKSEFIGEDGTVSNWLILFTVEKIKCPRCEKIVPEWFQATKNIADNPPHFKSGVVQCNTKAAAKVCDYFQFQGVPHIISLRADTEMFYRMWVFGEMHKTADGIVGFAMTNYEHAYTQGKLPWGLDKNDQPFWGGFRDWVSYYFQSVMEEGFFDL